MTERRTPAPAIQPHAVWLAGMVGLLLNGAAMLVLAGVQFRLAGVSLVARWFPFLAHAPWSTWWRWGWFAFFLFLSLIEIPIMALALRAMSRSSAHRPLLLTVGAFVFFPAVYAWMCWLFTGRLFPSLLIAAGALIRLLVAHFSIQ